MTKRDLRIVEKADVSIEERKKSLRLFMKRKRSETENRDGKELCLLTNCLRVLQDVKEERARAGMQLTVFVYLSFSSEAATDKLVQALREEDVIVLAPRVENGRMCAVPVGEDFSLSPMGIREPIGEAYTRSPDVAIVPFLAVDKKGNRLGYGGGCYDRYLKERFETLRVAYGYDFQLVDDVPHTCRDEKMHRIVTERRILCCDEEAAKEK